MPRIPVNIDYMTSAFRSHFDFFEHKHTPVYLDSASTTQRLKASLLAMQDYHHDYNSNVHRGGYSMAKQATEAYENARSAIAEFLGAASANEIVFTSGATAALNLIANGLSKQALSGQEIVLCISEHHANLLPWQQLAKRLNLRLRAIYVDRIGRFTQDELSVALNSINEDTALVAFAHVSNVLGNIYPVKALCQRAAQCNAISVIDGTQAAAHISIDVQDIGCDFYVISGHKMYASTGIGVLYGKYEQLESLQVSVLGGEMIKQVSLDSFTLQAPPLKFEAGTPNIAGALGMAAAAKFCKAHQQAMHSHEMSLYKDLLAQLKRIDGIRIWGNASDSIALLAFTIDGIHTFDLANALAKDNVCVRAGQHCAMPLLQHLNIDGCLRISIACYTSRKDIDDVLHSIHHGIAELKLSQNSMAQKNMAQKYTAQKYTAQKDMSQTGMAHINTADTHSDDTNITLQIEQSLKGAQDWNEKHRILLLESKNVPLLPPDRRLSEFEVNGCEARVWIAINQSARKLQAYSDSKVIRGLLSILLNKANGLEQNKASAFDFSDYLIELGLSRYFSQGRKDGMHQVNLKFKELLKAL